MLLNTSLMSNESASYDERVDQEKISNLLRSLLPRYRIARRGLLLLAALGRGSSTCGHGEESSERAVKLALKVRN